MSLNISVLGAAKDTYLRQLKIVLEPLLHEGFVSLWEDAEIKYQQRESNDYSKVQYFQLLLKDIPTWNQTILEEETRRILSRVDYLMYLVTAIFVSHVKILASVKMGGKNEEINIQLPTEELFIHNVYKMAGELIYYNPLIFLNHTERSGYEQIKDYIECAIDRTIDVIIPVESILKEYLSSVFSTHVKRSHINGKRAQPAVRNGKILSGRDIGLFDSDGGSEEDEEDLEKEYKKARPLSFSDDDDTASIHTDFSFKKPSSSDNPFKSTSTPPIPPASFSSDSLKFKDDPFDDDDRDDSHHHKKKPKSDFTDFGTKSDFNSDFGKSSGDFSFDIKKEFAPTKSDFDTKKDDDTDSTHSTDSSDTFSTKSTKSTDSTGSTGTSTTVSSDTVGTPSPFFDSKPTSTSEKLTNPFSSSKSGHNDFKIDSGSSSGPPSVSPPPPPTPPPTPPQVPTPKADPLANAISAKEDDPFSNAEANSLF